MSTFPMQPAPNHSHFFPSPSPAPSTSHYQFPQYWYNHPPANTSFATPSSSPGKRKRDGTFDEQDSSSSDDGGPDYNPSAHRGSHGNFNSPAQRAAAAAQPPPARPVKRPRREWNNSADDGSTGLGGTRPAGMENGFARMSLFNNRQQTGIPTTFVQEPIPIQRHEQPTKEVHMKTRSWYEPEKDRIVVLDLDGSDSDSETTPPSSSSPSRSSTQSPVDETMAGDGSGYTISQAYLSRIKGVPQGPSPPPNMNPYPAGALILYKNLPNLNGDTVEVVEPLDDSHPNYVLPNWGPIPAHHDRPLYATIEEVDDDEDTQMMDVDGN